MKKINLEKANHMASKDPRVDAYIEKAPDYAKPILIKLRELMHTALPDVEETIKWGGPHFDYKGIMCGIAAFKNYCSCGFWKEKLIPTLSEVTPDGRTVAERLGRASTVKDLPPDDMVIKVIKEAGALNEKGVKLPPKPKIEKKPLEVPSYFTEALRKNKKAQENFENFSPSHKREYVEWIAGIKSEEIREKRLKEAIEWIASGKSRHWKYQK